MVWSYFESLIELFNCWSKFLLSEFIMVSRDSFKLLISERWRSLSLYASSAFWSSILFLRKSSSEACLAFRLSITFSCLDMRSLLPALSCYFEFLSCSSRFMISLFYFNSISYLSFSNLVLRASFSSSFSLIFFSRLVLIWSYYSLAIKFYSAIAASCLTLRLCTSREFFSLRLFCIIS